MALLNITVPVDLGELGDFDSDVVFDYEEDDDGVNVTVHEILVNGCNLISMDPPETFLRDVAEYIAEYIASNLDLSSEEPLQ